MKKSKISFLFVSAICLSLFSSCTSSEEQKWAYTKEDMSSFITLDADKETKDSESVFKSDTDVPLFKEKIDNDDIIVYDVDKVVKSIEENKDDYASYKVLKSCSLPVASVETLPDKDGFNVTFEADESTNVGMLIHPSVTNANSYLLVSESTEENNTQKTDTQADFEEKYVTKSFSWEDGGKFIFQIVSNIGMLVVGIGTENPTGIATGINGLISALGENFASNGPTIATVMNQLKETDRKVSELSAKIDQNTKQLSDEIVRTEALVDNSNLNTLNLAINDFATNSLGKINTFNRNLADELGTFYKDFIKSNQTVSLVLTKDSNGKYTSSSLSDITDTSTYNFTIELSDFTNAKANLAKTNNIIETGFLDELYKDIDNAVAKKSDLPEGIDKTSLRDYIAAMIYEQFMKQYFSSNKDKAQEYRNLMIDYAERLTGANSKISILNTYLNRLQCMYNFTGEIKSTIRTLAANLLKVLDMNTARASEASYFAEYSYSELETDYKNARAAIRNFYKNVKETNDAYCFTTSSVLTGGFYQAKYNVSYKNPGNKCELKVNFQLENLTMSGSSLKRTEDSIDKHNSLSQTQHARITTRWGLLRSLGDVDTKKDYINYLASNKVLSQESIDAYSTLFSLKESTSSGYRILTGTRKVRDLNNTDSGLTLYCDAQGNPSANYFSTTNSYTFRQKNAEYWYGQAYEGTFIDASSGTSTGTGKLAAWARYAESHWYWSNDEYWAFTNDSSNNYFFMIDIAQ